MSFNQQDRSIFIYFSAVERTTLDVCHLYIRESFKYSDSSFRVIKVGLINEIPPDYNQLMTYLAISRPAYQRPVAKTVEALLLHICTLNGERIDADADNESQRIWFLFDHDKGKRTIEMIMRHIVNLRHIEEP